MSKPENHAEKTEKGLKNPKFSAENEKLTNKEMLEIIMRQISTMDAMIKSVDDRERLLQRQFDRTSEKLDNFIANEKEREKNKREDKAESKNDRKWMAATAISIILFIVSFLWQVWNTRGG